MCPIWNLSHSRQKKDSDDALFANIDIDAEVAADAAKGVAAAAAPAAAVPAAPAWAPGGPGIGHECHGVASMIIAGVMEDKPLPAGAGTTDFRNWKPTVTMSPRGHAMVEIRFSRPGHIWQTFKDLFKAHISNWEWV